MMCFSRLYVKKEIIPHALTLPANANQIMLERKSLDFIGKTRSRHMRLEHNQHIRYRTKCQHGHEMTDIVNTDNVQIMLQQTHKNPEAKRNEQLTTPAQLNKQNNK
eukprot:177146_1